MTGSDHLASKSLKFIKYLQDMGLELTMNEIFKRSNVWQEAIFDRAEFILREQGQITASKSNWLELLESLLLNENSTYYIWLAITGCYPTKEQFHAFKFDLETSGLRDAAINLVEMRFKNTDTGKLLLKVYLKKSLKHKIVDITHTYRAPYLTGIQRVVKNVTHNVENISIFTWRGDSGTMQEIYTADEEDKVFQKREKVLRINVLRFLHSLVPILDGTSLGKSTRIKLLPLARRIKTSLLKNEENHLLSQDRISNLFIYNCVLTVPEIPASLVHISTYEVIFEHQICQSQMILYDFIPFFHAWTVHPGNRGHLNSYIRLIFLTNRIISISDLVNEQAKSIVKVFSLERKAWQERTRRFDYLPLPSGLKLSEPNDFQKKPASVVMLGSLEPRKNHLQFLSALEILWREGIYVEAEILGSAGWMNEEILTRLHKLRAKGISVQRIGNISDAQIRQKVGEAQVLLQISEAEGFGLPIVEALCLGTKVIVSDIRPLNEWKNERVKIVQLGDSIALANELKEVLLSPEVYRVPLPESVSWEDWTELLYK